MAESQCMIPEFLESDAFFEKNLPLFGLTSITVSKSSLSRNESHV